MKAILLLYIILLKSELMENMDLGNSTKPLNWNVIA